MTAKELAERDYKKSLIALKNAEKRPNVPELELEHLRELVELRKQIMERIGEDERQVNFGNTRSICRNI